MGKRKFIGILALVLLVLASSVYAGSTTTSGVTAQIIIDRVRVSLNETTASFWTDSTDMVYWIDEAVNRIAWKTRCLESGASNVPVVANTRTYALGTFLDLERVEYDRTLAGNTTQQPQIYDLVRVPLSNLRQGAEKDFGDPKNFAVWNNTLYIYPIPRSEQSGCTIYVYKVTTPTGVTSATSAIETPAFFDTAIEHYVKAKAYEKDRQETRAVYYMALFEREITEYLVGIMRRSFGINGQ